MMDIDKLAMDDGNDDDDDDVDENDPELSVRLRSFRFDVLYISSHSFSSVFQCNHLRYHTITSSLFLKF